MAYWSGVLTTGQNTAGQNTPIQFTVLVGTCSAPNISTAMVMDPKKAMPGSLSC